jgi:hypothetical protein
MIKPEPELVTSQVFAGRIPRSSLGCLGGCLLMVAFALLGFCVGAAYGVSEFNAAVRQAAREHRGTDLIAANVPISAVAGAFAGALAGGLVAVCWRLIARVRRRTRGGH